MSSDAVRNVIILGSGPAGLTAATYLARAKLSPLVIAGQRWGGQLMDTTEVENYPGFADGIMGPELMAAMRKQAERFGAELVEADVTSVDFRVQPFSLTAGETTYRARSIIVATGASARWLGVPGEGRYRGHGVSACATCDGFFFKGKKVAVVGGGDASMEEATFLTRFASQVVLIARAGSEDELKASVYMRERVKADPKISIRCGTAVTEVLGDPSPEPGSELGVGSMTGLRLKDVATGQETVEEFGGLFVAIGHQPNTAFLRSQVELEPKAGYAVVHDQTYSNIPGIFVAGDVADWRYRQAVTAAGWGCMAALDVERYLAERPAA